MVIGHHGRASRRGHPAIITTPVGTLADIPLGIPVARRTAETITGNQ
jgi:hypothetical protein